MFGIISKHAGLEKFNKQIWIVHNIVAEHVYVASLVISVLSYMLLEWGCGRDQPTVV